MLSVSDSITSAIADLLDLSGLTLASGSFLLLAIALALSFEFVNGFHDTANAVATVIYTNSLKPVLAVIWSGIWNLIGVLTSTGIVAFSVVGLLPAELVLRVGTATGFAMVFALLISAIIWNLGTWYFGLPNSSSHTLIGSILGVGLANALLDHSLTHVDWTKAQEVLISLLTSPLIGFSAALLLLLLVKRILPQPELYSAPEADQPPPFWIRALLILTCTGVSFAHGSNDGQKGMGLIMLILVGLLPGLYALNLSLSPADLNRLSLSSQSMAAALSQNTAAMTIQTAEAELAQFLQTRTATPATLAALATTQQAVSLQLSDKTSLFQLSSAERSQLRSELYLVAAVLEQLERQQQLPLTLGSVTVQTYRRDLNQFTQFIPLWVKVAVAVALGSGTMIGWKRIVVTIGERIGKTELTYAQGATAEFVTLTTILAADRLGLPVSTTHVLSSGVAGTMTANQAGIQTATVRNILLSWVLTLPVCILLGGITFLAGLVILQWLNL